MAKYTQGSYDFVIDSNFKPFSFTELAAPLEMLSKSAAADEEEYLKLKAVGDTFKYLENYADKEDPAYQLYSSYMRDLDTYSRDFNQHGKTYENTKALSDLRARFSSDLGRVAAGDMAKKTQIKEQKELYAQDPTRIFSREAADTPISAYMENPNLSYMQYSGAAIQKAAAAAGQALSKSLTDFSVKHDPSSLNTLSQTYGFSPQQVAAAVMAPYSQISQPVLDAVAASIVKATNIHTWNDPYALKRAMDWARSGLWSAVGIGKVSGYNAPRSKSTTQKTENDTSNNQGRVNPVAALNPNNASTPNASQKRGGRGSALAARLKAKANKHAFGGHLFVGGGNTESGENANTTSGAVYSAPIDLVNLDTEYKKYEGVGLNRRLENALNAMSDEQYNEMLKRYGVDASASKGLQDSVIMAYINPQFHWQDIEVDKKKSSMAHELPLYNVKNILTPIEEERVANDAYLPDFSRFFAKSPKGNWALTRAGKAAYEAGEMAFRGDPDMAMDVWKSTLTPEEEEGRTFALFIKKHNLKPLLEGRIGPNQTKVVNNYFDRLERSKAFLAAKGKYDAKQATEYQYPLNANDFPQVSAYILNNYYDNNKNLHPYKWTSEGKDSFVLRPDRKIEVTDDYYNKNGDALRIGGAQVVTGPHGNYLSVLLLGNKDRKFLKFPIQDAEVIALNNEADAHYKNKDRHPFVYGSDGTAIERNGVVVSAESEAINKRNAAIRRLAQLVTGNIQSQSEKVSSAGSLNDLLKKSK